MRPRSCLFPRLEVVERLFRELRPSSPGSRLPETQTHPRGSRTRPGIGDDSHGGYSMATARLRVFPHPEEDFVDTNSPSIPVRLSDLYPLLAQAYRDNYVWLQDFEEEQLMVSSDLFEVIRAFTSCRPSA